MEKSNHFLEFHDTEQIALARFVHDDVYGLHAQYRSRKSTHQKERSSALGFPTYMYMYLYLEFSKNLKEFIHLTNMSVVVPSIILLDGIVFTSERSVEYTEYRIHAVNSQLSPTYHVMNFAP